MENPESSPETERRASTRAALHQFASKAGIVVADVIIALSIIVMMVCVVLLISGEHGKGVIAALGCALLIGFLSTATIRNIVKGENVGW